MGRVRRALGTGAVAVTLAGGSVSLDAGPASASECKNPLGCLLDGTTRSVDKTVGGTTKTLDRTVGGTTRTVNRTVRGTTSTVGGTSKTLGGITKTVDHTVSDTTRTVNTTVGGTTKTVRKAVDTVTKTVTKTAGGGSGGSGGSSGGGSGGTSGTSGSGTAGGSGGATGHSSRTAASAGTVRGGVTARAPHRRASRAGAGPVKADAVLRSSAATTATDAVVAGSSSGNRVTGQDGVWTIVSARPGAGTQELVEPPLPPAVFRPPWRYLVPGLGAAALVVLVLIGVIDYRVAFRRAGAR